MRAVELFTGAGGLAMGVSLAGFELLAAVEWDRQACDTIRKNQRNGFPLVASWPLIECDVRKLDLSAFPEGIDLVAGGIEGLQRSEQSPLPTRSPALPRPHGKPA